MRLQHIAEYFSNIGGLLVISETADVRQGERVEILDETAQPRSFVAERIHSGAIERAHAIFERLDLGPKNREWRAKLVCNVRDPLLPRLLCGSERCRERIHVPRELCELVVSFRLDTSVIVAAYERSRAAGEQPDAPGEPVR